MFCGLKERSSFRGEPVGISFILRHYHVYNTDSVDNAYITLVESVPILATSTHLLDEFSSCMYDRFSNGKLVELRLKLILFLERQNQIWFNVRSTNLLFVEQLAAGSCS